MKFNQKIILSVLILMGNLVTATSHAALSARGLDMVYDDVLDITWLKDANFARTSGYATINAIDNGSSAYDNILSNGRMGWNAANAWAASLTVGGYTDWRLPDVKPVNNSAFNYNLGNDGSKDRGYNISSTQSELGYMFYQNLGNTGYRDVSGVLTGCTGIDRCLTNAGLFDNLESKVYWSSAEYLLDNDGVWGFSTGFGFQGRYNKKGEFFSWAVRSGDVAVVPLPTAIWFMGSALLGVAVFARKNTRGWGLSL